MWTARSAAVLGLLLAGCVPGDHPPWLIDHPTAWGLVASVVQPGPYASGLVVPKGAVRADALPLDTVELQWLVAAPPDTPPLPPPLWIVCARGCPGELRLEDTELAPECPDPLPLSRDQPCRLGEGERIRLTLAGAFSAGPDFLGHISLAAIGSADPDLSSETCLERLSSRPYADLQRCIIQNRTLELGPPLAVFRLLPALAETYVLDVPPDAVDAPDTHPRLSFVVLTRESEPDRLFFHAPGETASVRVGERITVEPLFVSEAEESYLQLVTSDDDPHRLRVIPLSEHIEVRVGLTALVDDFEQPADEFSRAHSWVVPDAPDPLVLHLYVSDGRQGRAHATLRLVPEGPPGAP